MFVYFGNANYGPSLVCKIVSEAKSLLLHQLDRFNVSSDILYLTSFEALLFLVFSLVVFPIGVELWGNMKHKMY